MIEARCSPLNAIDPKDKIGQQPHNGDEPNQPDPSNRAPDIALVEQNMSRRERGACRANEGDDLGPEFQPTPRDERVNDPRLAHSFYELEATSGGRDAERGTSI